MFYEIYFGAGIAGLMLGVISMPALIYGRCASAGPYKRQERPWGEDTSP